MESGKILVVDDDAPLRASLTRLLERSGFEVVAHDLGFGLAVAVARHRPDLVLLDVQMPGLDGDGAVRASRSAHNGRTVAPVFLLHSGLPAHELAARAAALGLPWVHKPYPPRVLVQRIRSLLAAA